MSKWVHRVSDIDPFKSVGVCLFCGPTALKWVPHKNLWVCLTAFKQQRGKKSHGLTSVEATEFRRGKPCEICGSFSRTVVDHDHSTGDVRGVLCSDCNLAIGLMKDNVKRLQNAIQYLTK